VSPPSQTADWVRLFKIARALIRQVNSDQSIIDHWTLGGGTAMMLQINHRESNDVDIFLSDPQFLSFLDPQKRDFQFEIWPTASDGDGVSFQKLAFKDVGEIDFIIGRAMTSSPAIQAIIEGEATQLETIPEIIAKKIYYRGSSIKPRDIFDIAAAAEEHAESVIDALRAYRAEVQATLEVIDKLNPDFVNGAIAQLSIKDKFHPVAKTALKRSRELLQAV
jgi:protein-disulfide isomerase-like protein with CxxC motif